MNAVVAPTWVEAPVVEARGVPPELRPLVSSLFRCADTTAPNCFSGLTFDEHGRASIAPEFTGRLLSVYGHDQAVLQLRRVAEFECPSCKTSKPLAWAALASILCIQSADAEAASGFVRAALSTSVGATSAEHDPSVGIVMAVYEATRAHQILAEPFSLLAYAPDAPANTSVLAAAFVLQFPSDAVEELRRLPVSAKGTVSSTVGSVISCDQLDSVGTETSKPVLRRLASDVTAHGHLESMLLLASMDEPCGP